ncbi:MAG: ATP-binding cassette domain-containing protein [Rhodovibrionaceae bacterium]|nr:ATP-binding cassette domain-containing protein [Rhodovibrionaceae bacterium]
MTGGAEVSNGAGGAPVLGLREVTVRLGSRVLIDRLSLDLAPGETATVMGPSGCGKSSLLAYICGSLDPAFSAQGAVYVEGREITRLSPEDRRVGILFQDDLLFPHMSVAENLAFAIPPGLSRSERRALIAAALADAGLEGLGERDTATLSGGQRARAALMRTLLARPAVLLLDEPFSKLDVDLRTRFREFVFDHARQEGLPVLMVTHDPTDARHADGRIIEIGAVKQTPE